MQTEILCPRDWEKAAGIIASGGLVAVPTETVYGLAGNGMSPEAVAEIYEVKGRPARKPLSLMVSSRDDIEKYCIDVPRAAYALADRFWPGPLTIVLRASPMVPEIVRAGGDTVGLRCPVSPSVREIIRKTGLPLAAPSANISGSPSPKTAEDVLRDFGGKIPAVIDGGECSLGLESTIIDLSSTPYKILRPGAVSQEAVFGALAENMTIIGITGGSGSGKTTALEIIRDMGGLTIDCDAVYHELLACDLEMQAELLECFPGIMGETGIDRKKLGRIVFSDPPALEKLNAITHRHVHRKVDQLLLEWAARGGLLAAVDAVALIEAGMARGYRAVVGIIAPTEDRIQRIISREGLNPEYARLRVEAQKPDSFYLEHCDHVLNNDGSREEFREKCRELFRTLTSENII